MSASRSMNAPLFVRIINISLIVLLCLSIILPFMHILALAFNEGKDAARGGIIFLPRILTFENFKEVFKQDNLLNGLGISIFRTVIGTLIGVNLTALAAYALMQPNLPGKGGLTFFIFFTMLFGGGTVPFYLVLKGLKLTNTIFVYIIPWFYSVTNILLLRTSFKELPASVIEAARIDGYGEFSIFYRVVVPMSKPVLATVSLFEAVWHWNDWFSGTFYVRKNTLKPLATLLQEMLTRQNALNEILLRQSGSDAYKMLEGMTVTGQSLQMATIICVILPIVIMYPFIQKYFVKGITVGSVKG